MLGLRLTPEIESRLARFVRRRGVAKSEVARSALIDYLDRHENDDDFERQVAAVAVQERKDRATGIDDVGTLAWRTIDRL